MRHHCPSFKNLALVSLGVSIGLLGWKLGSTPLAACLVPLVMPLAKSRAGVYAVALGYTLAAMRDFIGFSANWFDGSIVAGLGCWAALSALASAPWPLVFSTNGTRLRKAVGIGTGFLLALLPPFSSVVPAHPLIGWGFILPGTGFLGVITAMVITVWSAYIIQGVRFRTAFTCVAMCVALTASLGQIQGSVLEESSPRAIDAINTFYGKPPVNDAERVARVFDVAGSLLDAHEANPSASVLVLPETTLGRVDSAFESLIKFNIDSIAAEKNVTIVLGAERSDRGELLNEAQVILSTGERATVRQRHPALLSMWRPWAKPNHFPIDLTADNLVNLGDGYIARVMICYEEFIPFLYMLDELKGGHQVSLVISNNWSADTASFPHIQALHAHGMFRLFGREYVRSVNFNTHAATARNEAPIGAKNAINTRTQ